jgi:hypothetical protein
MATGERTRTSLERAREELVRRLGRDRRAALPWSWPGRPPPSGCYGAAGLYNVPEPDMADQLKAQKAAAVEATGAAAVVVGNPGCAVQIAAGLAELGSSMAVLHPAKLLDQAYVWPLLAKAGP